MRRLIATLGIAFLAAGSVAAQGEQQQQQPSQSTEVKRPHPLDPADVNTITGRDTNLTPFSRAPKPGHPLDPNDVATLTGRPQRSQWITKAPRLGHPLDPADVETLSSNGNEGSGYRPFVTTYLTPELYANSWNVADPNFAPSQFENNSIFFSRSRRFHGTFIFPFSRRHSSVFFGNRFDGSIFFRHR